MSGPLLSCGSKGTSDRVAAATGRAGEQGREGEERGRCHLWERLLFPSVVCECVTGMEAGEKR